MLVTRARLQEQTTLFGGRRPAEPQGLVCYMSSAGQQGVSVLQALGNSSRLRVASVRPFVVTAVMERECSERGLALSTSSTHRGLLYTFFWTKKVVRYVVTVDR